MATSTTSAQATPQPLVHIYTQNIAKQLPAPTSAGSLPTADHLAAPNIHTTFLATGRHLQLIQPLFPSNPTIRPGRQGPFTSDFIPLTSRLTALDSHSSVPQCEIESVSARSCSNGSDQYLVASVDSYGVAVVSKLNIPSSSAASSSSSSSVTPFTSLYSHTLRPSTFVEDGWHGVCLHPTVEDQTAVASFWGKSLSIYNGDRLIQNLYTMASPTTLKYLHTPQSNEALLCTTEGNALSIWDLRVNNSVGSTDNVSRGAVQRLQDVPNELYALDTHHANGLVAVGGVDKQVSVFDARKWQVCGRWKNVLKYEIMSLQFAAYSPQHIYVTGLDHEVYCGQWGNQGLNARNLERAAFRGDSRWIGLARTSDPMEKDGGDQIVGVTQSAQLYLLRNAHLQNGPVDRPTASSSLQAAAKERKEALAAQRKERVAQGLEAATEEEQEKKRLQRERKQENKKRRLESEGADGEENSEQPPEQKQKTEE